MTSCDPRKIIVDVDAQSRTKIDPATVDAYAEDMENGDVFPPVEVFRGEDGSLWCGDGHHRVLAARKAGVPVDAHIVEGGKAAAMWSASGANKRQGLRRTSADKRKAVRMALAVRPDASDRDVARHVGVTDKLVATVRSEVSNCGNPQLDTRTGADGKDRPADAAAAEAQREAILDFAAEHPSASNRAIADAVGCSPTTVGTVLRDAASFEAEYTSDDEPPAAPPTPRAEGPRDANGVPVPPELLPVWADAKRDAEVLRPLREVRRALNALAEAKHEVGRRVNVASANDVLARMAAQVKSARPHVVCPVCNGQYDTCQHCAGRGWLNKAEAEALAALDRASGA